MASRQRDATDSSVVSFFCCFAGGAGGELLWSVLRFAGGCLFSIALVRRR